MLLELGEIFGEQVAENEKPGSDGWGHHIGSNHEDFFIVEGI